MYSLATRRVKLPQQNYHNDKSSTNHWALNSFESKKVLGGFYHLKIHQGTCLSLTIEQIKESTEGTAYRRHKPVFSLHSFTNSATRLILVSMHKVAFSMPSLTLWRSIRAFLNSQTLGSCIQRLTTHKEALVDQDSSHLATSVAVVDFIHKQIIRFSVLHKITFKRHYFTLFCPRGNRKMDATSQMHILSIILWQKLELSWDKCFMGLP